MFQLIRRRWQNSNPLLRNLILGQLSTVLGAFLINVLSARALGPENRGEIALILQLSYLAGAIIPLGRDRAALQARFPNKTAEIIRATLVQLSRGPLLVLILFSVAFAIWRARLNEPGTVALGFSLLLVGNILSRFLRSEAILEGRGTKFTAATVIGQIGLVAAGGSLLVASQGDVHLWILVYGLSMSVPFIFLLLGRNSLSNAAPPSVLTEARGLGIRLLPPSLIDMAMTKTDKLLLPLLGSYTALGYYAIAVSLVDFSILPFRQYIDSKIPQWARLNDDGALRLRKVILSLTLISAIVVAVVTAGSWFAIPLLFGEAYSPARDVLPWLAVASFFHILTILVAGIATAIASSRSLLRMYLVGIACALPLYFWLIPPFGAIGAAIAQATAFAGSALTGLLLVSGQLGRDKKMRVNRD